MNRFRLLRQRLRQKGLRRSFRTLWERHVYSHWELLWMQRDLDAPIPPSRLREHPPVTRHDIGLDNLDACLRHFAHQLPALRLLAEQGHTGHMYLDPDGHAVAIIWGSAIGYFDRDFYGCHFAVAPGEYFQFCGEVARPFQGTRISIDLQANLWAVFHEQGMERVTCVVTAHNHPALALHVRMGYQEQGRVRHVRCLFGRWKFFSDRRYEGSRLEHLKRKYAVTANRQALRQETEAVHSSPKAPDTRP